MNTKQRILIREATPKDAEDIIEVLKSTKLDAEKWANDEDWARKTLSQCLNMENYAILVAEIKGKVVGFIGYAIFPSFWECMDQGLINDLFVHEAFQGKGVGGKLVEAVVRRANQNGIDELHVSTGRENARARRLYAKYGFLEEQPLLERAKSPR